MIKNNVAVVTAGLCGNNNGYRFQQKNYNSLLINGSVQDNKAIPEAKNILVLLRVGLITFSHSLKKFLVK